MARANAGRVRAVLFDAAGTLLEPHPSLPALVAAAVQAVAPSIGPVDAQALMGHVGQRMRERRASGRLVHFPAAEAEAFWRGAYQTFFVAQYGQVRAALLADSLYAAFTHLDNWQLFDDALPALEAARAMGLRVGLLSNWEAWLADLLPALGVRHLFDSVTISGVVGLEKPDPAIFEYALRALGVTAAESAYVGDDIEADVLPALALGMRAVLVDRGARHQLPAGAVHLPSLTALHEALA